MEYVRKNKWTIFHIFCLAVCPATVHSNSLSHGLLFLEPIRQQRTGNGVKHLNWTFDKWAPLLSRMLVRARAGGRCPQHLFFTQRPSSSDHYGQP